MSAGQEILAVGGYTWKQVHAMDKSGAIAAMTESISKMLLKLVEEKKIDGAMGMGRDWQNTVMCSAALRLLPIGFPDDYLFHDRQRIPVF